MIQWDHQKWIYSLPQRDFFLDTFLSWKLFSENSFSCSRQMSFGLKPTNETRKENSRMRKILKGEIRQANNYFKKKKRKYQTERDREIKRTKLKTKYVCIPPTRRETRVNWQYFLKLESGCRILLLRLSWNSSGLFTRSSNGETK